MKVLNKRTIKNLKDSADFFLLTPVLVFKSSESLSSLFHFMFLFRLMTTDHLHKHLALLLFFKIFLNEKYYELNLKCSLKYNLPCCCDFYRVSFKSFVFKMK